MSQSKEAQKLIRAKSIKEWGEGASWQELDRKRSRDVEIKLSGSRAEIYR